MIQLGVVRHNARDLILTIRTKQSTKISTPGFLSFPLIFLTRGNGAAHVSWYVSHIVLTDTWAYSVSIHWWGFVTVHYRLWGFRKYREHCCVLCERNLSRLNHVTSHSRLSRCVQDIRQWGWAEEWSCQARQLSLAHTTLHNHYSGIMLKSHASPATLFGQTKLYPVQILLIYNTLDWVGWVREGERGRGPQEMMFLEVEIQVLSQLHKPSKFWINQQQRKLFIPWPLVSLH